jgi:hypothetical protein
MLPGLDNVLRFAHEAERASENWASLIHDHIRFRLLSVDPGSAAALHHEQASHTSGSIDTDRRAALESME